MSKFELLPRAWYSSDYRVMRDGAQLTCLKFQSGPERSVSTIAGEAYLARKEKWNSPNFFLYRDRTQLAKAAKPNWFSQTISFEHHNRPYTLKPRWSEFTLVSLSAEVGSIMKPELFSRAAVAKLPDDFSLPLSIFTIWLVLLMWKRNNDSAAAG